MMDASPTDSLARLPESIAEWEDLLVRYEIMPRALRVTLEEAPRNPGAAAGILRRMIESESSFSAWIDRASPGGSGGPGESGRTPMDELDDPRELADRFASIRSRNFAMLQRRGIDVWEWSAAIGDDAPVTAFQMVTALVRDDASALGSLRAGLQLGAGAC